MAEQATIPSCAKLQLPRSFYKLSHFVPRTVCLRIVQRGFKKQCYGSSKVLVSAPLVCDFNAHISTILERSANLKDSSMRCCCFGTLISPDNATVPNWVPVLDQALMMFSIVLAYIAGVVPPENAYLKPEKVSDLDAASSRSSSGSAGRSDQQVNVEYAWAEVKSKLLGALDAAKQDGGCGYFGRPCRDLRKRQALPLPSAYIIVSIAVLSLVRMLVNNISGSHQVVDRGDWMGTSSEVLQISSQSVFVTWLEEELNLECKKHDKNILLMMLQKLKQDDNITKNIKRSGKDELYADLLYFLRFRFLSTGCRYDNKLLAHHGVDILEDLVITLADGITTNYLELISVDSNMSSDMNRMGLNLCSLSTRALQKLRNEMALKQWLHQNMDSVVSMYEDRFDLYSFQIQLTKEADKSRQDKLPWWKKLTLKKATPVVKPLQFMVISPLSMPVKRTRELRALNGWRYYFSLFLEFSDITMPLVRVIFSKICSAISFFLVCLVGRSLGLIYSGIRQSLGWR
ncbi:hypothetical protein IFM89_038847 [Coptis chinensis]|uniref:Uncharacterized protein n=1 Tax=Coptis chinensis TaxID=261450 RepID=A0A835M0X0_9MAGN|nr:hypothetical protein IFM89_038847 [Coptis chinensis]